MNVELIYDGMDGNKEMFITKDKKYSVLRLESGRCLVYKQSNKSKEADNWNEIYNWTESYYDNLDECCDFINKDRNKSQ